MNHLLRALLTRYRDTSGCRLPGRRDGEDPCDLCRLTDDVLGPKGKPLAWDTDQPIVADLGEEGLVTVEQAGPKWTWRVEWTQGWRTTIRASGEADNLPDAITAAEDAAQDLE
jgi:hypothetical protein